MNKTLEAKCLEFIKIATKQIAKANKMKLSLEALELKDNGLATLNIANRALQGDKQAMEHVEHMHFI